MEIKKDKHEILKKTIQLICLAFIAKGLGFVREIVLAYYYGTSAVSDVFVAVQNIPAIIFSLFGIAVTTGFIPLYTDLNVTKGKKEADKFANNVFNIFLILAVFFSLMGIIFSKQLVYIFAGGFSGNTYILCNNFTKIVIPTSIAIILVYVYNAYLQINGFFNQNSLMNVPYNIVLIISIALSFYSDNSYILAIGLLIASFSQFVYLNILMKKKTDFKHFKYVKFNDKMIKKMLILVGPVFISTGVNQINTIVDRALASRLVEGSVSALNYSNEVIGIVTQVIILSLTTILYPKMTRIFLDKDDNKKSKFVEKYINIVLLLVFPLSVLIFHFSSEIIEILFGRGAFNSETIIFVGRALKVYALGILGASLRDVLNKVFYSMKNTVVPMINGIIAVSVNILINFILINKYQYLGLAFATAFSSTICTILMFYQMIRKIKNFSIRQFVIELGKIIISIIIMICSIYFMEKIFHINNSILRCIIYGGVSLIMYIIILVVLKQKHIIGAVQSINIKKYKL